LIFHGIILSTAILSRILFEFPLKKQKKSILGVFLSNSSFWGQIFESPPLGNRTGPPGWNQNKLTETDVECN